MEFWRLAAARFRVPIQFGTNTTGERSEFGAPVTTRMYIVKRDVWADMLL